MEGDPNLLNDNEILVIDSCGCGCPDEITLKQLDSEHRMHTMVLMNADEYIRSLEGAYKQGYAECKESMPAPAPAPKPETKPDEPYIIGLDS